jgi:hypothetical protein
MRLKLISEWWSITRSLAALAVDRRMTVGLADELVDCVCDYRLILKGFREDVAVVWDHDR